MTNFPYLVSKAALADPLAPPTRRTTSALLRSLLRRRHAGRAGAKVQNPRGRVALPKAVILALHPVLVSWHSELSLGL
jgi:hypothetical protein